MWYYIFLVFILLGCLLLARINSAYHPNLLIKKYVFVKSKKLQKLFIFQSNPLEIKIDNKKDYQDKIVVVGFVSYILWFALVVFSVCFLVLGPRTAIVPFEFDDGFFISALNQAVVFMSSLVFLGFEMSFYFLNIVKSPSINVNKIIQVIWYIVILIIFSMSIAGVVEILKMLL